LLANKVNWELLNAQSLHALNITKNSVTISIKFCFESDVKTSISIKTGTHNAATFSSPTALPRPSKTCRELFLLVNIKDFLSY
jgi:hypothetical protein